MSVAHMRFLGSSIQVALSEWMTFKIWRQVNNWLVVCAAVREPKV